MIRDRGWRWVGCTECQRGTRVTGKKIATFTLSAVQSGSEFMKRVKLNKEAIADGLN